MQPKINILSKMQLKANQMSFLPILTVFLILLNMNMAGCKKDDTSTISGDLQVVPREAAYAGCYPVLGTSQTKSWDSAGNIITPVLGEAFFGQDAQFTHTAPVYTKSSDGLTVKDEVTGLTWQKTYDSGTYYWASIQTVVDNLNTQNYGGYNDWRVPTIKELYSLWNVSVGWPYIDTEYFDIKYTDEQDLSHAIFGVATNIPSFGQYKGKRPEPG
ncbi:MAG: DUF1566 domain-containing protein [Bacteroidales bacterium]|nr:DUF1566 domain-containing protein [Bacteroidales bacterium]